MTEITLDGITKRFPDGTVAVRELDLVVADGEFMILVGPSGCGKSTALRMVAGLESISSGELRIDGQLVNGLEPSKRDIAMVFQTYALYPHLSVRENIAFSLRVAGVRRREIRERVEDTARILDLTEYLDRRPANLSGGQRQRVAMGRAIVRQPRAYLMDEPLSNLDAKLRVQMRAEISLLQRRLGTTTIFVTHDQTEAMTLGDRVAVMRRGVLQHAGTPQEVYDRPHNMFVAGFIGSPAMSFLPAERQGDGVLRLPIGEARLTGEQRSRLDGAPGDTSRVVVGIRPEHWRDAAVAAPPADAPVVRVRRRIELVESTGSDVYVFFPAGGDGTVALDDDLLADEAGGVAADGRIAARLTPSSRVAEGAEAELWVDARRLHLFDQASGDCIAWGMADGGAPPVAASAGSAR